MSIRYYLVPFETDLIKLNGALAQPKHVEFIRPYPEDRGYLPFESESESPVDGLPRWLRPFYILRINHADGVFSPFDTDPECLQITKTILLNNIAKLEAIGIDTTGLTASTPLAAIERRLRLWLQNEDKDFDQ